MATYGGESHDLVAPHFLGSSDLIRLTYLHAMCTSDAAVFLSPSESSFRTGGFNLGGEPVETNVCFPWILDVFKLTPFNFYKIIESFIKAEPTLSKDIVKHLETCENLIMERIAWRTVSDRV